MSNRIGLRSKEKEQRTAPSPLILYELLTGNGSLVRDNQAENILVGVVNCRDFADTTILSCSLDRSVNAEAKKAKEAVTA